MDRAAPRNKAGRDNLEVLIALAILIRLEGGHGSRFISLEYIEIV
jgi:hypothetical protein